VKSVDGDFNNVVGLPVDKLREMLKEFGIGL
jgi:predicted house-cleaning NTP pyrophosphatase (Maf/HAM1 superfamily)